MLRFLAGVFVGYTLAKRPPTQGDLDEIQQQVRLWIDTFFPKKLLRNALYISCKLSN